MNSDKNNNSEIEKDLENSEKSFTLGDFSRETGIRIELLRRFINRQTRQMKNDALEKIYPTIKELLGESDPTGLRRIGPAYRRHAELVEMFSDQKVLLDVFTLLPASSQSEVLKAWSKKITAEPTSYKSLNNEENQLMGMFLAMDEEMRSNELLALVKKGTAFIRSQR